MRCTQRLGAFVIAVPETNPAVHWIAARGREYEVIRYLKSPNHVMTVSTTELGESVRGILGRLFPKLPEEIKALLVESVVSRERLRSTVLPGGVAFPRAEYEGIDAIVCAAGIADQGIRFGDGCPTVHTFFLTLYPKRLFNEFVPLLEHLVAFSQNPQKMALLRRVPVDEECFAVVRNEVLPWGARDWVNSHVVAPVAAMLNRVESAVRPNHG